MAFWVNLKLGETSNEHETAHTILLANNVKLLQLINNMCKPFFLQFLVCLHNIYIMVLNISNMVVFKNCCYGHKLTYFGSMLILLISFRRIALSSRKVHIIQILIINTLPILCIFRLTFVDTIDSTFWQRNLSCTFYRMGQLYSTRFQSANNLDLKEKQIKF